MKFKYSKFLAKPSNAFPDLKEVWRPVVPIKIINQEREYGYLALVDSGADFCIFHGDIGELLGLPVRKGKTSPIYGVTKGEGKVYLFKKDSAPQVFDANSIIGPKELGL